MSPSSTVKLSEIPNLTSLYESNTLQPSNYPSKTKPSAAHNNIVSLIRTDITTLPTTCIVNAANKSLLGGSGVDGAIHRAAGPDLLGECRPLKGCNTGSAKITSAYNLPAEYVIHAVGPIYDDEDETWSEQMLSGCYKKSLELAVAKGASSIAFSALSTGIYGYPSEDAAEVACETVRKFLDDEEAAGGSSLEKVVFCNFTEKDEKAYLAALPLSFPPVVEAEKDVNAGDQAQPLSERLPNPPAEEPATDHGSGPDKKKQKLERDMEQAPTDQNVEEEKKKVV